MQCSAIGVGPHNGHGSTGVRVAVGLPCAVEVGDGVTGVGV
jgi:hypothetical protein